MNKTLYMTKYNGYMKTNMTENNIVAQKIWKVYVKVRGERELCTNAMEYETKEKAEIAAIDLQRRWILVDSYELRQEDHKENSLLE